jgi:poly(A) polymerase
LGAAFGVITVLGPKGAGQIEVATFRSDAEYSDGRHPDRVVFSTAREDASRRDFTINGLFYDPIRQRVIDFVGGQEDLRRQVIRAIGDPEERFGEDKLRMLRAVRFAATFDFTVDQATQAAIRRMAPQITAVSAERIAEEMGRMLVDPRRAEAARLLLASGLAGVILPEIVPAHPQHQHELESRLSVLSRLREPGFPLALSALLPDRVDAAAAERLCRRWRMSNLDTARVRWLVEHRHALKEARSLRWSVLQPVLIAEGIDDLVALGEAEAALGVGDAEEIRWCRSLLGRPRAELDPPPILTGDDLLRRGLPPGPVYKFLLDRVRAAQLDGEIRTREDALRSVDPLLAEWSEAEEGKDG